MICLDNEVEPYGIRDNRQWEEQWYEYLSTVKTLNSGHSWVLVCVLIKGVSLPNMCPD